MRALPERGMSAGKFLRSDVAATTINTQIIIQTPGPPPTESHTHENPRVHACATIKGSLSEVLDSG